MTTSVDDDAARLLCDPVGVAEIADRLGMKRKTLDMIRYRGGDNALPPARWAVGGWPAWEWITDVVPWAVRTGRWPQGRPVPEVTPGRCLDTEPCGLEEICHRLGIKRDTLDHVQNRGGAGALPEPRWILGGSRPVWDFRLDVEPWARRTGRWPARGARRAPAAPNDRPGRRTGRKATAKR